MVAPNPPTVPSPFTPSPEALTRLLADIANPGLKLHEIAQDHGTTLPDLTDYLAREDTQERLDAIEEAYARRARLIATAHLPTVAHMLTRMLDDHLDETAHIPVNPKSLPALEQRRRSRETARQAATLLLRISKFQTGPTRVRARHAEDEAPPQSLPSSSSTTPNPRVSPSTPSGPLSRRERAGVRARASCLPSSYMPSALHCPTSPPVHLPTSSSEPIPLEPWENPTRGYSPFTPTRRATPEPPS